MKYLATLFLACASVASSAIIVVEGNAPFSTDNVLFNGTGSNLTETLANPNIIARSSGGFLYGFDSDEELVGDASGQARVEAADGSFNDLLFYAAPSPGLFTFTGAEFNLFLENQQQGGSVSFTITTLEDGVINSGPFTLDSGQNRFYVQATGTERILSVSFTSTTELNDLRQLRVGGEAAVEPGGEPGEVPEPLSMGLMGAGLGVLGLLGKYRKS